MAMVVPAGVAALIRTRVNIFVSNLPINDHDDDPPLSMRVHALL